MPWDPLGTAVAVALILLVGTQQVPERALLLHRRPAVENTVAAVGRNGPMVRLGPPEDPG